MIVERKLPNICMIVGIVRDLVLYTIKDFVTLSKNISRAVDIIVVPIKFCLKFGSI
jgi:hypothetical protein